MSTYRLNHLFEPRSVVVFGGSPRPASLGRAVIRNLREAGFRGALDVVNPHYDAIEGLTAVKHIDALANRADVAVIAVPDAAVPGAVAAAGAAGTATAVIIGAGLGHGPGSLADAAEQAARQTGLRLVGPNCLGVMVPSAKFNASVGTRLPPEGDLALLSQSGGIVAGMAEWAARRAVGFSAVVSIGDQVDVDFGDLLDYFAMDWRTRAILLYMESIKDARKFMSAARAAARAKPVVVVKSGRHEQGARAAATHTGALAGTDAVYDAAFHRAGLLRVRDLDQLFNAAETLGRLKPFSGNRLAVLTNGGGVGVLAIDRLSDLGGTVAELSAATRARLDAVLPPLWSKANPVDIGGDADAERYGAALGPLLADPQSDAILVLNFPTALVSSRQIAARVAEVVRSPRQTLGRPKPVLAAWIGGPSTAVASAFEAASIPHYDNEAQAVQGFMDVVRYSAALDALMKTPPSLPTDFRGDFETARGIVADAIRDGRTSLDPPEIGRLFAAYAIPITPAILARDPPEAAAAATSFLGAAETVVVKILSRDIVHKSDVDGVRLNLTSTAAVQAAAADILTRARTARPDAQIAGVTVHPMVVRPKARELIAGIADDPTFGPVIVFGSGGIAAEAIDDKALALPPLDMQLATDLIARTRVARVLKAYRNMPAVRQEDVALLLVKLAQLVADVPEVLELDINPLLADERGVLALDARVAVAPVVRKFAGRGHPRLAVRPYPSEWEQRVTLPDTTEILVRPIRPEDEPLLREMLTQVTPDDLRLRFFAPIKDFSHAFIARLVQIDYARAMAFVAIGPASGALLGVVRLHADANYESGEYAILLRSDMKGRGLGRKLMDLMIAYARSEGLRRIEGQVLAENAPMLTLCKELGFRIRSDPHEAELRLATLALDEPAH